VSPTDVGNGVNNIYEFLSQTGRKQLLGQCVPPSVAFALMIARCLLEPAGETQTEEGNGGKK